MSSRHSFNFAVHKLAIASLLLSTARPVMAETWNVDANGLWSVAANWNPQSVPNGAGAIAAFGPVITADRNVTLDMNVTLGGLGFDSAHNYVIDGNGVLTFQAAAAAAEILVASFNGAGSHVIEPDITLGSPLQINVFANAQLTILGAITGNMGLEKNQSPGVLTLAGSSTYTGGTSISAGTAVFAVSTQTNQGAIVSGPFGTGDVNLGDTAGTDSASILADTAFQGSLANKIIVRAGSTGTATVGSATGSASYSGELVLNKNVRLHSVVAGGVEEVVDFTNQVSGTGGVTTQGFGRIDLTRDGGNTYSGGTTVNPGALVVSNTNGSATGPGAVIVNNQGDLISSNARIAGAVTVNAGGRLLAEFLLPTRLNTGDLTLMANSRYVVFLRGLNEGGANGHSRCNVTGAVDVTDSILEASLGFAPAANDVFFLIDNDGIDAVTGTFVGLAQGATLDLGFQGTDYRFVISYTARVLTGAMNGGNDVALECTGAVPAACDPDGDGDFDANDVTVFVLVLLGQDTDPAHVAASDFNQDGLANGKDTQAFITALLTGGCG